MVGITAPPRPGIACAAAGGGTTPPGRCGCRGANSGLWASPQGQRGLVAEELLGAEPGQERAATIKQRFSGVLARHPHPVIRPGEGGTAQFTGGKAGLAALRHGKRETIRKLRNGNAGLGTLETGVHSPMLRVQKRSFSESNHPGDCRSPRAPVRNSARRPPACRRTRPVGAVPTESAKRRRTVTSR